MIDIEDVPTRPVPASRAAADKRLLRLLVSSQAASPLRRRRLLVVGALVAVGLTGGTAAAAYSTLAPQHAPQRNSARCYATVSRDTGDGFPGTTVGIAAPKQGARPQVPPLALQTCAELWQRGFLTPAGFKAPSGPLGPDGLPPANHRVPALVACVLHSGQVAVFPGPPTPATTYNCHDSKRTNPGASL